MREHTLSAEVVNCVGKSPRDTGGLHGERSAGEMTLPGKALLCQNQDGRL